MRKKLQKNIAAIIVHLENKSTGLKKNKYVRMTLPGLPIPAVETSAELCFLCSAVHFFPVSVIPFILG